MNHSRAILNGEPVECEPREFEHEACCDCGLTHYTAYEYDKEKNKIIRLCYRDDWKTKEIRFGDMDIEDLGSMVKILRYVIRQKRKKEIIKEKENE